MLLGFGELGKGLAEGAEDAEDAEIGCPLTLGTANCTWGYPCTSLALPKE